MDADIPPVATDGTVVVAGGDTLAGLSAGTGEKRWTVALDGRVTGLATLGDGTGRLHALGQEPERD